MAMLASISGRLTSFDADLENLKQSYPEIEAVVADLEEFLKLDYTIPEIAVDPENMPLVYAVKLDYPPMKAGGRSRFLVIYHATDAKPSMITPFRTFTLLAIRELLSGKALPSDAKEAAKAVAAQIAALTEDTDEPKPVI